MAGRVTCGSTSHRRLSGRGSLWPIHPLLVCLVACVLAYQIAPSMGVCTSNHEPTVTHIWRKHLDRLSDIARDILDDDTVVIPNSYSDEELREIMDQMRQLAPGTMANFDNMCQQELTQALDNWIWMCRGLQTLGRRRKRDMNTDKSA